MSEICTCGAGILNLGAPVCQELLGVARKLVFVSIYADDGTQNRITLASTFGSAEYVALVNNADRSKRWYPSQVLDNVDMPMADPNYETMESDEKYFVSNGLRTLKASIMKQSAVMLGKLNSIRCNSDVGIYIINTENGIEGEVSSDGLYLEPIKINTGAFYAMLERAKDKTLQKIILNLEFSRLVNEANLANLTVTELGFSALAIDSLLDVNAVVSGESTTGFTVALKLDYGTAKTKIPVTGLLVTDFKSYSTAVAEKVRNVTTAADVAITSVTEVSDGVYTFVFSAQTAADVIKVDLIKTGYEHTTISATLA